MHGWGQKLWLGGRGYLKFEACAQKQGHSVGVAKGHCFNKVCCLRF